MGRIAGLQDEVDSVPDRCFVNPPQADALDCLNRAVLVGKLGLRAECDRVI